jgi:GGDEF domain-containing protein
VAAGQTVDTVIAEQRLPVFDKLLRDLQASSPSPDALIHQADHGLYEAKQAGRGTFRLVSC